MAFANSINAVNLNPRKSITELLRDAIDRGLDEEAARVDVFGRIPAKRRFREIYRDLSNEKPADRLAENRKTQICLTSFDDK